MARRCGVQVDVFSVGIGKELFGFTDSQGTRWRLSLIPLGGYVKMLGDADATSARVDEEKISALSTADKQKTLISKTPKERMLISFAGPFANLMLAWIFLYAMLFLKGIPGLSNTISHVEHGSIAQKAGVLTKDTIVQVNGAQTQDFSEVLKALLAASDENVDIVVLRNKQKKALKIDRPSVDDVKKLSSMKKSDAISSLGLVPTEMVFHSIHPLRAIGYSLEMVIEFSKKVVSGFASVLTDAKSRKNVGGIFSIAQGAGQSFDVGFWALLQFAALLSINLGVINLFPIPMLDGGKIVMDFIEHVTKRPVPLKYQEYILYVGLFLVIGLMGLGIFNDILKFFGK